MQSSAAKHHHVLRTEPSKNVLTDLESLSASVDNLHAHAHAKKQHHALHRHATNGTFEEEEIFDWLISAFKSLFGSEEPPKVPKTLEERYPSFPGGHVLHGVQYSRRGKFWQYDSTGQCTFLLVNDPADMKTFFTYVPGVAGDASKKSGFNIDANAPVGFYDITCQVNDRNSRTQRLMVIFDAWSLMGLEYIKPANAKGTVDQAFIDEYLGATTGAVWQGSAASNGPKPWNYDQYSRGVIYSLYLLQAKFRFSWTSRQSPALFAKHLSGLGNANSNGGVLVGRWSQDFAGGKQPQYWSGSGQVFNEYAETEQPVKFGQCWVFAGILTTMCRAFGIPARPLTNFESGHNSNIRDLSIDVFWTMKDSKLEYNGQLSDSVWNFHVWVEAMIRRDDIAAEYSGWQVIDATPQELAEDNGQMENGPAPVKGVYMLDQQLGSKLISAVPSFYIPPYDTSFVYGETTARRRTWIPKESTGFYQECTAHPTVPNFCLQSTAANVGLSAVTKKMGSMEAEDVIGTYKVLGSRGFEEDDPVDTVSVSIACSKPIATEITSPKCDVTVKSNFREKVAGTLDLEVSGDNYFHSESETTTSRVAVVKDNKIELKAGESKTFPISIDAAKFIEFWRQGRVLDVSAAVVVAVVDVDAPNAPSATAAIVSGKVPTGPAKKDSKLVRVSVSYPLLYVTVECSKQPKNKAQCSAKFHSPDSDTGGEFTISGDGLCSTESTTCDKSTLIIPATASGASRTALFTVDLKAVGETNAVVATYVSNQGLIAQGSIMVKAAVTLTRST